MPIVDLRDVVGRGNTGGSDTGLQVYLSDVEAQEYKADDTEVAGWFVPFTLEGGTIGFEVDEERDRDEAGQLTGKILESNAEWVFQNTIKEFSPMDLRLRDILARSPHKFRYALPFENPQEVDTDGGTTIEERDVHMLFGLYNGTVNRGWEAPTSDGELRTNGIEIRGSKTDTTPSFIAAMVDVDDETTWQYVTDVYPAGEEARLSDFETAAV